MIFGIGTDILDSDRIKALLAKHPERFIDRLLHPLEQEDLDRQKSWQHVSFIAKKFAAKEAFFKALGTGLRDPFNFKDVHITHSDLGQPILHISSSIEAFFIEKGFDPQKIQCHLSLSDERLYIVAFVTIEVID